MYGITDGANRAEYESAQRAYRAALRREATRQAVTLTAENWRELESLICQAEEKGIDPGRLIEIIVASQ